MRRKLASLSAGSLLGVAGLLAPLTGVLDTATGVATATVDDAVQQLTGTATVLVVLDEDADVDAAAQAVASRVDLVSRYDRISVLLAEGPAEDLRALAELPGVARLQHDAPVQTFTDTSHTATRGQQLLDGR